MLLYYLFWMFMGFILYIIIVFRTNLLTGGPTQNCCFFAYFRVSKKRKTKWSSIDPELHGTHFWKERSPEDLECMSGDLRGGHEAGGRAHPPGRALHPRGPLIAPPTYFFLLYISIYPENIQEHHEILFSTAATFCTQEIPSWGLF